VLPVTLVVVCSQLLQLSPLFADTVSTTMRRHAHISVACSTEHTGDNHAGRCLRDEIIVVNALQTLGVLRPFLLSPPYNSPFLLPSLPIPSPPHNLGRGSGERCKFLNGSGQSSATKHILVRLNIKMKRFRGQISRIINKQNLKVLWYCYRLVLRQH